MPWKAGELGSLPTARARCVVLNKPFELTVCPGAQLRTGVNTGSAWKSGAASERGFAGLGEWPDSELGFMRLNLKQRCCFQRNVTAAEPLRATT